MLPLCLQVERSLTGRCWRLRQAPPNIAQGISQRLGLPAPLGDILAARGVAIDDDTYLEPRLRELLPDPHTLADMPRAAERFADAICNQEPIGIFGDYDVDGATSTAMLQLYLKHWNTSAEIYIPDRNSEGYGPNIPAMQKLAQKGVKLLLTVDCGTMAHEALAEAKKLGVDVIVTDHHQIAGALPEAFALVNPRRVDDTSALGHLAGVGVAFMLLVATNRIMRQRKKLPATGEPRLTEFLDLVALGTVCDVVPLQGVNRAFVRQGVALMQQTPRLGIVALCESAKLAQVRGAGDLGFVLGPRINAGGRVAQARLGVDLFLSRDNNQCHELAQTLNTLNSERRDIEATILKQAQAQLQAKGDNLAPPAVIAHQAGWHAGVIGIVASRLKEQYQRPAFVIAFDGEEGKGSARSLAGIDLGQLVSQAVEAGCLLAGGGHAMAAGFSLSQEQLPRFEKFVLDALAKLPLDEIFLRANEITIDAVLGVSGCDRGFYEQLQQVGPFGAGNPEPRFALADVSLDWAQERTGGHIALRLSDGTTKIKAIAFASTPENLRAQLLAGAKSRAKCHLVGRIKPDDYMGRAQVEFHIEDAQMLA